ncbi:MAG: hemerythrin domain-containing protein [Planctomycetota bacterium]
MLPIGPLMIEHRLIEKMIGRIEAAVRLAQETGRIDSAFFEGATDFLRTYADRCHHGKEEDILFRALQEKPLSHEHRRVMDELKEEHIAGRKMVRKLLEATKRAAAGTPEAAKDAASYAETLIRFYPAHIDKEDNHFFRPAMEYLTKAEQHAMLIDFQVFDQKLIHEKYKALVG